MDENPLRKLRGRGQNIWLNYLRRALVDSGDLQRLIDRYGLSGVESDLDLLAGAVSRGGEYSPLLARLAEDDDDPEALAERLLCDEARLAAGFLAPLYEDSEGRGGFVGIDVVAGRSDDPQTMSAAVHRAAGLVDSPNVVFKVPATDSGFAVVEAMAAEGYHMHVGPLYSLAGIERAVDSFAGGRRRRLDAGVATDVVSTVSFGLAPLDTAVDDLLRDLIRGNDRDTSREESLLGSAALATAKVACRRQRELLQRLFDDGSAPSSRLQRIIWTGISTKNPRLGELSYIEELIGPDSGFSMSRSTIEAFCQRGTVDATLGRGVDAATEILDDLATAGIDLAGVGSRLEQQAAERLTDARTRFVATVAEAREALAGDAPSAAQTTLGSGGGSAPPEEIPAALIAEQATSLDEVMPRLWAKDPSLWSDDPAEAEAIRNRLGWIDLIEPMSVESLPAVRFAGRVLDGDIEDVVVLGMGGSSVCAEACRAVFGIPNVWVLDSTIPAVVMRVAEHLDPARTLVVVSSKSGTTLEARALADYFYALATPMLESPGDRFVAVTDPGTPLEQSAHERDFLRLWSTPPDVGGRFSAFTHFGVLPMALMEVDVAAVLRSARDMAAACAAEIGASSNPALQLGAALHEGLLRGRDKLTFLCDADIAPFASWVEQLVAESLGKHGTGIVPIVGEPAGDAEDYGDDRLFVGLELGARPDARLQRLLDQLAADHPVIRFRLDRRVDIGGEFFRWEMGTAVAAAMMGVNPFDEPEVQSSKQRTREILDGDAGADAPAPIDAGEGWAVFADLELDSELAERRTGQGLESWLDAHLGRVASPDYVGLLAFLAADAENRERLDDLRWVLRDRLGVASSLGWGPAYLHASGQLHKGGPNTGVFLIITATDAEDLECPGMEHSFGRLARAQALGDLKALQEAGRRVLRVHLDDPDAGLDKLADALERALG